MDVLIIENSPRTSLGQVAVALSEAGHREHWARPHAGDALPEGPDGFAAIVVLGGEQSALDDHSHPYIPDLARLMLAFEASAKPVLGICLGSQILARAHGGTNHLGVAREFGWHHVTPTRAASNDPVLGAVDGPFPIFEWHSDTFTLPPDAVRLATNPAVRNQCFRIGRASYGMQFHFEAHVGVVEDWNRDFAPTIERINPYWFEDYEEHKAAFAARSDAAGLAIARAWTRLIGTR